MPVLQGRQSFGDDGEYGFRGVDGGATALSDRAVAAKDASTRTGGDQAAGIPPGMGSAELVVRSEKAQSRHSK